MNCVFMCVFSQRKYVDMAFLLLDSLHRYGELGDDTEIVIYTTTEFMQIIRDSPLMSDSIRFEINDRDMDVRAACRSRLDLFELNSIKRYEKILYLDTDVVVKGDVHRVYELVQQDLLYALAEGDIRDPTDTWGAALFGSEVEDYRNKVGFCSGVLAFNNCDAIRRLFAAIKEDMVNRPGDFVAHDQPYFVYNALKYGLVDNQVLKMVVVNDSDHVTSDLVIHHFPGGPGNHGPKIHKMIKFIEGLDRWRNDSANRTTMTTNPRDALSRQLLHRGVAGGTISLPAAPSLLEDYVNTCDQTFAALGAVLSSQQLAHLRECLADQLTKAYEQCPGSKVVVTYDIPYGPMVHYRVDSVWYLTERQYRRDTASGRLLELGAQPDARVWQIAQSRVAESAPALTIGPGIGRTSVPLARRGHRVDAVETSGRPTESLRDVVRREGLDMRVIDGDLQLVGHGYQIVDLSGVTTSLEGPQQLRSVLEFVADRLAPGGALVFNIFLARAGYVPDQAARELGRQTCSTPFSYGELDEAVSGLPLELVSDDAAIEFERAADRSGAWPPDPRYEAWAAGLDVFLVEPEQSPIELRWLVYRRID